MGVIATLLYQSPSRFLVLTILPTGYCKMTPRSTNTTLSTSIYIVKFHTAFTFRNKLSFFIPTLLFFIYQTFFCRDDNSCDREPNSDTNLLISQNIQN